MPATESGTIKGGTVKKNDIKRYSIGEEIFNSVSHGVGAALSVAALVLCVVAAAVGSGTALAVLSSVIYGASLIILYMSSTLYHALTNAAAKKVFRIFDHSSIFILIAGTYTPILLVSLQKNGVYNTLGIVMCSILWGVAILGVVLNSLSIEKFKILSMIFYICMGWAAIWTAKPMIESVASVGLILLLIGGAAYTGGLLFYGMKKFKYMHSIWHLFVLSGSILHFFAIILYVYGNIA